MTLSPGCPRCASAVSGSSGNWHCEVHGEVTPLWRPEAAGYDTFVEHLTRSAEFPSLLPWPFPAGWAITDFGCVARPGEDAHATFMTCAGPTDLDGVVEITVVTEEPGVGLGARCAGVDRTDPGVDIVGSPHVKVRLAGHPVPLWSVSTSEADVVFDRSVFAGEAQGRWMWLVLRPASAALLLSDAWGFSEIADLGPELVDVPFGGQPPAW
ncbi:MAG: DUF6758 family protein [Nocardioidaceae bacterium]